jgi:hypothetical protein
MKIIIGFLIVMAVLVVLPAADFAFAAGDEPGEYLDRRVVIWNLFYKMMTVAIYSWICSFWYYYLASLEI